MDRFGIGPQHAGDPPFRKQMRRRQSWYRSTVLGVPYGTGPRASYVALAERGDSAWRDDAWSTVGLSSTSQLWRNHLSVEALRRHRDRPFGSLGRSVVARHPLDLDCAVAVERYRESLVDSSTSFIDWPLDLIVAGWRNEVRDPGEEAWLDAFTLRYLELEASQGDDRVEAGST